MRQSSLFSKTRKDVPADEQSRNAELLIRAGFIHKEFSGAYSFLPLGRRVLENVIGIIREEMHTLGAQELSLTALQESAPWEASGRWSDEAMDVWFKTQLKNGGVLGLAPTHEEAITRLMSQHVSSHKDLPLSAYQFQTKFRNEVRARSGLLRTREFLMKDLYSFGKNQEELDAFYEEAKKTYVRIFDRLGIGASTVVTFASGGAFSKYSHEFQTLCASGEDTIYVDKAKNIAVNKEVFTDDVLVELGLEKSALEECRAIEVGNIFKLGTRFSEAEGLTFKDENGGEQFVVMGSYGIGPARVMATVVELLADEKGMVWPEAIAPYRVHLLVLGANEDARAKADELYATLRHAGVEVLYDDREASAGEKFADADLMGLPWRMVVSEKSLAAGGVELRARTSTEASIVPFEGVIERMNYVG